MIDITQSEIATVLVPIEAKLEEPRRPLLDLTRRTRLLQLAREAASVRLEQGTNTLFLTLGIVEWREVEQGPTCRAPLVFVPVDLDRRNVQSRYSLRLFEDEVITNPCLVELCKRTFG